MNLDGTAEGDDDIRLSLTKLFADIRDNQKDVMDSVGCRMKWSRKLVRKSSGHFIYASTVLKFVDDEETYPPDQLYVVLGNMAPSAGQLPFQALDELYHGILERAATRNYPLLTDILGSLIVTRLHVTVKELPTSRYCSWLQEDGCHCLSAFTTISYKKETILIFSMHHSPIFSWIALVLAVLL